MGAPRIKDEILRYLAQHPNVTVWRRDIAEELKISEAQITQAIGSTFRTDSGTAKDHIVVVEQGRAWRWSETPVAPHVNGNGNGNGRKAAQPKTKRLFEELATLPDGRILAHGDDAKVYWLTEV